MPPSANVSICRRALRALRLAAQDAALSRRKHGFDSRRARQRLEPPFTPEEQQILGGVPPYPDHFRVEVFSVNIDAADERYRDGLFLESEMIFYYRDGADLFDVIINGKSLGREAAGIIQDSLHSGGSTEEWLPVPSPRIAA